MLDAPTWECEEVTLSDVAMYSNERISASELNEDTYVGVDNLLQFKQGKTKSEHVPKEGNLTKYRPNDILIGNIRPYLRKIWFADNEGGTNGDVLVVRTISDKILPKYLYCNLSSERFFEFDNGKAKGAKMPRGDKESIMSYSLRIPSIDIQQKVVKTLENFDSICNNLNIGLPAEIEARQKQYEYYRDLLLTFAEKGDSFLQAAGSRQQAAGSRQAEIRFLQYVFGYASVKLSELFNTKNGYTPSKSVAEYWADDAYIPWFRMDDIRENGRILEDSLQHVSESAVKGGVFPKDSIIISTSATIGEHAWIRVPSIANQRFTYLMPQNEYKDIVDMNYIFYYCFKLGEYCRNHLNQGNFASVDMTKFGEFIFMIPEVEKQREIATILKKMDSLCNDISEGLPAEIEARQKQYEYYRDKLLKFKEKMT